MCPQDDLGRPAGARSDDILYGKTAPLRFLYLGLPSGFLKLFLDVSNRLGVGLAVWDARSKGDLGEHVLVSALTIKAVWSREGVECPPSR
jgi:hypothetical protein